MGGESFRHDPGQLLDETLGIVVHEGLVTCIDLSESFLEEEGPEFDVFGFGRTDAQKQRDDFFLGPDDGDVVVDHDVLPYPLVVQPQVVDAMAVVRLLLEDSFDAPGTRPDRVEGGRHVT